LSEKDLKLSKENEERHKNLNNKILKKKHEAHERLEHGLGIN